MRETESNLHFRKGSVAERWKINWHQRRLEMEKGKET